MADLIDRQAAIKAIDDLPNCYNGYSDTYDKAYIIETLEEVPSVQPEPQWIPCSERLPEESGRYLVTNTRWGAYHVDWNIYYVNREGHCDGWLWEQGCTAWMPLPKPYEEEDA